MGRKNKKKINYKKLRGNKRFKRDNVEKKRLEKLEKANHRKKLKLRIKIKLNKLTRKLNLNLQYLN